MLNKIMIIGHAGRDPEVSQTQNGTAVARLSVAVSRRWTDRGSQERKEETTWFSVIAYDQLAQTIKQYVHKGSRVYLEGRMQSRKYTDREGAERTAWEIIASDMQLLDPKPDTAGQQPDQAQEA